MKLENDQQYNYLKSRLKDSEDDLTRLKNTFSKRDWTKHLGKTGPSQAGFLSIIAMKKESIQEIKQSLEEYDTLNRQND